MAVQDQRSRGIEEAGAEGRKSQVYGKWGGFRSQGQEKEEEQEIEEGIGKHPARARMRLIWVSEWVDWRRKWKPGLWIKDQNRGFTRERAYATGGIGKQ